MPRFYGKGERKKDKKKSVALAVSTPPPPQRTTMMGELPKNDRVDVNGRVWDPRVGRYIIPLETIIALRKRNLTYTQIAKTLGCSKMNIQERLKKIHNEIERVDDFKKHKADILAIHQNRLISSITPEVIEKAGLKDRAIAFGVMYDKERLERGKSTQNVAYADLVRMREQKEKELKALEAQTVQAN